MKQVKPVMLLMLLAVLVIGAGCTKERFTNESSALLQTTTDTLHFDTVFTSTGSITQVVKILNPNNRGIRVNSVRLSGGTASPFRLNVDGMAGTEVKDVEIPGNDSIYVFVRVSIDPTSANLAFIVRDSLEISYNGNRKFVQLDAFGRNAHFYRNKVIKGNETWNNDLPYVILGRLTVDTNATLTINRGCRIYLHADAPLVVNGSLQTLGEHWDSTRIVFSGDRLDEPYRNYPASYPGIVFTDVSKNNSLLYTTIKNAYQGIVITDPGVGTKLGLKQVIIDNAYDAALIAVNTSIRSENLLVSNCGKSLQLLQGGSYQFDHTTVACISNAYVAHKNPALTLSNFLNQNNVPVTAPLSAVFRNSIFWGENNGFVDDEVVVLKAGNGAFNVSFDHVLWRVKTPPANTTITSALNDQNPLFDSVNIGERVFNFRVRPGSPAIDKGVVTGISVDLDGLNRAVGPPDLGAYERQ